MQPKSLCRNNCAIFVLVFAATGDNQWSTDHGLIPRLKQVLKRRLRQGRKRLRHHLPRPFTQQEKRGDLIDNINKVTDTTGAAPPSVVHGPRVQADAVAMPVVHGPRAQPSVATSHRLPASGPRTTG